MSEGQIILPTGTPDIEAVRKSLFSEGVNEINAPALWRLAEEIVAAKNTGPFRIKVGKVTALSWPAPGAYTPVKATVDIDGGGHTISNCTVLSGTPPNVNDIVAMLTTDDGGFLILGTLNIGGTLFYHPSSLILARAVKINGQFPNNVGGQQDSGFLYNLPTGWDGWAEVTTTFAMGFSTGNLTGISHMIYTNYSAFQMGAAYQNYWSANITAGAGAWAYMPSQTLVFPASGGALTFTIRFGWTPTNQNCYYDGMYSIKVYRHNSV